MTINICLFANPTDMWEFACGWKYNTAESEAKAVSAGVLWNHLEILTWSDVMDAISYVQWCDGLSRASSVSSRAARVRTAARLSEAARRIVRLRSHRHVGRVSVCEANITGEERGDFVLDRTCFVARMVWTSVEYSQDNRRVQWWAAQLLWWVHKKTQPYEFACAIRSSDEETESSHEVTDRSESESKRHVITFTGHDVACNVCNTTQDRGLHTSLTILNDLRILGAHSFRSVSSVSSPSFQFQFSDSAPAMFNV